MVGGRYGSWPKEVARRRILRGFRDIEPELVLDLWGGGNSARALTTAGFAVLSVDDGRAFDEFGVTKPRGRRALTVLGDVEGYETAFGDAADHAVRADAAFLDFMGHWAPDKKRVLLACRHMKAVAVTLMPERTPLGRLDDEDWILAHKALLEAALQMRVRWTHTYRRNEYNQQATVYFLRPAKQGRYVPERSCMDCPASLRGYPPQTRRCASCIRRHNRTRLRGGLTHAEYCRKRYDPERERARRSQLPPEAKAEKARKARERYASDPEYRERMKANARAQHHRKTLTAVQSTAAEALDQAA